MKRQYLIIYVVYISLGLSLGLWEVFKPVWLLEKGASIGNLGGNFFCSIIYCSDYISNNLNYITLKRK